MTGVLAAFKQNVRLFVLDIFLDVPATLHLFHARIELDDVSRQLDEALRTVVVVVSFGRVAVAVPGADEAETAHGKVR